MKVQVVEVLVKLFFSAVYISVLWRVACECDDGKLI
jgi:hypothetical protein